MLRKAFSLSGKPNKSGCNFYKVFTDLGWLCSEKMDFGSCDWAVMLGKRTLCQFNNFRISPRTFVVGCPKI